MRTNYFVAVLAVLSVAFSSCDSQEKDSRKSSSAVIPSPISIDLEDNSSTFVIGKELRFRISSDASIPDSANPLTYLDDSLLKTTGHFPFSIEIPTNNLGTGEHVIRVSLSVDGKIQGKTKSFTLLSDVVPVEYMYKVVNKFTHDRESYTQGLIYHEGILFESKGMTGVSELRKVDLKTGKVNQKLEMDKNVFAEGIAWHNNRIYQLTWTSKVGFIYHPKTFEETGRFYYEGEGWGLTSDSTYLIKSDGSHRLTFHRESDFAKVKTIEVYTNKGMCTHLNELEYIEGKIYANVWRSDDILVIDPNSGKVERIIHMTNILNQADSPENVDVLNGIAYDPSTKRIFVTGKYWPNLFEIVPVLRYSAS